MSREALMSEAYELLQQHGKLPRASLPAALRGAGLNPSEAQLRELLASLPRNKGDDDDDGVDRATYEALVARCAASEPYGDAESMAEAVRDAFRVFDHDHSGTVSLSEFRHIMTTMGEKYTDDEFRNLVAGFADERDGSGSGVIRYEQLVDAMLAPFTDLAAHGHTSS